MILLDQSQFFATDLLTSMACGRVENCSDQPCLVPAMLPQIEYLSELYQFLDYNSNKKRFLWNGNAGEHGKFIEDRVLSCGEAEKDAPELAISSNSQYAVFRTPLAITSPLTSVIVRRLSKFKAKPVVK